MVRLWKPLVLLVILVACAPRLSESPLSTPRIFESPVPTEIAAYPQMIDLEEGMGAITGRFKSLPWAGGEIYVYACPFFGPSNKEGFYILEPSVHPSATVKSEGIFQLVNVPPGAYVLVVGPSPEQAIAFKESGRIRVFQVKPGQTLDLGVVDLDN